MLQGNSGGFCGRLALQQTNSGTDGGKEASCKKHDSLRNAVKHPKGCALMEGQ
jgi:hypothetical protein